MTGSLNGVPFTGSTMLVAGGGFCVGVSRAALPASEVSVGDEVEVQLERANTGRAWAELRARRRRSLIAPGPSRSVARSDEPVAVAHQCAARQFIDLTPGLPRSGTMRKNT
jgi:hypothetical protein